MDDLVLPPESILATYGMVRFISHHIHGDVRVSLPTCRQQNWRVKVTCRHADRDAISYWIEFHKSNFLFTSEDERAHDLHDCWSDDPFTAVDRLLDAYCHLYDMWKPCVERQYFAYPRQHGDTRFFTHKNVIELPPDKILAAYGAARFLKKRLKYDLMVSRPQQRGDSWHMKMWRHMDDGQRRGAISYQGGMFAVVRDGNSARTREMPSPAAAVIHVRDHLFP